MDDVTDLFGGVTIDVKSNYTQKDKTEEINISVGLGLFYHILLLIENTMIAFC